MDTAPVSAPSANASAHPSVPRRRSRKHFGAGSDRTAAILASALHAAGLVAVLALAPRLGDALHDDGDVVTSRVAVAESRVVDGAPRRRAW